MPTEIRILAIGGNRSVDENDLVDCSRMHLKRNTGFRSIAGNSDTLKSGQTGRCRGTDHRPSTALEDRIGLMVIDFDFHECFAEHLRLPI